MENEFYVETANRSLAEGGIELFSSSYGPNRVGTSGHIHEAIELIYPVSGSYTMHVNGVRHEVGAGDLVLFRSGAIHRINTGTLPENRYFCLKIMPSVFLDFVSPRGDGTDYLLPFLLDDGECRVIFPAETVRKSGMSALLEALIRERETGGYGAEVAIRSYFSLLLLAILRETAGERSEPGTGTAARIVCRTIVYLNRHYAEEISEETCCRMLSVSRGYFSRVFSRVTHRSFRRYLNEIRIRRAERALVTTERSVTEIAADCGFQNVSYFIATFRKLTGRTPLAARRVAAHTENNTERNEARDC